MYQLVIGPNQQWTVAPSMNALRSSPTCSLIITAAETREVVVVGGNFYVAQNSVKIFDVDNNLWRTG